MSPDGHRIAGACLDQDGEYEAVVWVDGAMVDLGHMGPPEPPLSQNSFAYRTTNDGVVLGNEAYADLDPTAYVYEGGAWTRIVNPTTSFPAWEATGISPDGQVITGNTVDRVDNQGEEQTFRGGFSWDRTTGDYVLAPSSFFADKCDDYENCAIFFMSLNADGTEIVGYDTYDAQGAGSPVFPCHEGGRWIEDCDMDLEHVTGTSAESDLIPVSYELSGVNPPVRLPLPGGYPKGVAQNIARNGSAIVGAAMGNLMPTVAVYWDQNLAVHIIGSLGPDTEYHDTMAYGVADDGNTIVGRSNGQAFIFTRSGGLLALDDYLKARGLEEPLDEWSLLEASAISRDGHLIAGTGLFQEHYPRGYLVSIP